MTPMMPQQNGMMQGNNMMAGLSQDVLKKVLKSVSETVSMQASEAIISGVPYGHVLEQLIQMAPQASLMGGGSPPPGGPGGEGKNPNPQPPGGMAKREEAMQMPPQQGMAQNIMQPSSQMTTRGGAQGQDLNALLVPGGQQQQTPMQQQGQQQGGNWLFNQSSVDQSGAYKGASAFGGMFKTAGSEALASQQALNLQPNQQINIKKREAEEVPLGIARKEELGMQAEVEYDKEMRTQLNEFRTNVLREPKMSGADAKVYNIQKQALQALMTLEEAFNGDPATLGQLNVPGNKVGQQIASAVNIFTNAALRDESGGVITKDEINSFKKDLSPSTGFRAALVDPDAQKLRIQSFKQRLQGALKNIDPYVDTRDKYKMAKKAGYTDQEIFGFMRQKGMA